MKKKIFAIVLCVAMLAIAIVGGTMAYFTDTDTVTNTMTVGKVQIEQNEYEWNADLTGVQAFTQNKTFVPANKIPSAYVAPANAPATINGQSSAFYTRLDIENAVDKYITVKNTADAYPGGKSDGSRDAYVRTIVLLPSAQFYKPAADGKTEQWFIWVSANNNTGKLGSKWAYECIDGVNALQIGSGKYEVMTFTYTEAIAPQYETEPCLRQLYMRPEVTQEDMENISNIQVLTLTQAAQANGFDDAETALNTAFGEVTAANLADWFSLS